MTRSTPLALVVAASLLAACSAEVKPDAAHPAAGKPADAAKTSPAASKPEEPAAPWSPKDAKGFDWSAQMGSVQFDTNWQAAMKRAKSSAKPLLFLFTEKTSPDAAKTAATFKDPRVVAASAAFVVALVDNETNEALAERYGVKGVPMVVYADPAGEALGATIGVNPDELLADIKGALATMKEDADEAK